MVPDGESPAAAAAVGPVFADGAVWIVFHEVADSGRGDGHIGGLSVQNLLQRRLQHIGELLLDGAAHHGHAGQDVPLGADIDAPAHMGAHEDPAEIFLLDILLKPGRRGIRRFVVIEEALQDQAQRGAVVEEMGNVIQVSLIDLVPAEEVLRLVPPLPEGIGVAHLHALYPQRGHKLYGLPDAASALPADDHGDRGGDPPSLAALERVQDDLLRAGDASHPVVVPHAVEAELDRGIDFSCLQLIQKVIRDKQAVGVDGGDRQSPFEDRVHQIPEVPAHHGLAAGELQVAHAAALEGVQHGHQLVPGGFALSRVRCGHEAMAAAVVAAPGDRPLDILLEAGGIEAVFLLGEQALLPVAGQDVAKLLPVFVQLLLLCGQRVPVDGRVSVAVGEQLEFRFFEKIRLRKVQRLQRVWEQLPAPQGKAFRENVVFDHVLSPEF